MGHQRNARERADAGPLELAAARMTRRPPTLRLGQLTGTWATVYAERDRLEADADRDALAAWRALLGDVDLADVVALAAENPPPPGSDEQARLRRQHLQQALAAAVLARLTLLSRAPGWARFLAVLASGLAGANATGAASGDAVTSSADTVAAGQPAAPGAGEDVAAYLLAAQALKGLAATVARVLLAGAADGATSAQLAKAARGVLAEALPLTLAVATAVAVAFTAGLTSAYLAFGAGELAFITAGDTNVCATCAAAEDANPYPVASVPAPPLHPNCRCTLQPA
ncbi:hypothetical protein ABIA32_002699 [Streptacidiphilus sp. MAP12-20]|uniref:hypothetical protein n=1 Tax=Streptacidiphilus sp. MAP12-20 TaxID=3156299 RepID=UPI0035176D29